MDLVLKRVELLANSGISELNIIGQDITGYGIDLYGKKILPGLLRRIVKKAKGIGWLRLLYLYPDALIDELLEVIADEPKICRYIDLPIQHINDRILKLMNRRTAKKDILNLIDKIRRKIPAVAIRTSLIVGFPSETEKEFTELLEFVGKARFERLGAFIYSREEGTPAARFNGQLPEKIKTERFDRIMSCQKLVSQQNNRQFLGKVMDVLIDEQGKGDYLARSQYDAPEVDGIVYVKSASPLKAGDFVKVKISDTLEYDLVGETPRPS
jgi:ribosomal protein S12 methylthiotransferase